MAMLSAHLTRGDRVVVETLGLVANDDDGWRQEIDGAVINSARTTVAKVWAPKATKWSRVSF
jgi:hypothetical protein